VFFVLHFQTSVHLPQISIYDNLLEVLFHLTVTTTHFFLFPNVLVFYAWVTVHLWIVNEEEIPTRCNNGGLLILKIINISSTCFGCLYTHHQEGRSCCVLLPMVLCSGCSCDGVGWRDVFTVTRKLQPKHNTIGSNTQHDPPSWR
jgi:hypothetical protein